MPKKLDLVGVAEVADLLDISRQRVHQLVHEDTNFPEPVAELGGGRMKMKVWLRDDIVQWATRTGREMKGGS